ncbi:MAG: phosphate signaling complex protein PhoU [Candidatus Omnitrophica bacterium]|nr:phosphate signaling complex protein PhoU [Candidatus Omnitrophota bacterium]
MQRHFTEDLKELNEMLLRMSNMTEIAIDTSIEALKGLNATLAQDVVEHDALIDELEIEIEEKVIDILALHQPLARDLRFVTTALHINANLERIADLAVNISQRVLELSAVKPLLKPLIDIPRLSQLARDMVRKSMDSFVNHDEKLAREVIQMDAEADHLRNGIQEELTNEFIMIDGKTAPRAIPLLLIARHLERICDQATNIAESVIYLEQAIVVKHHPEKLQHP